MTCLRPSDGPDTEQLNIIETWLNYLPNESGTIKYDYGVCIFNLLIQYNCIGILLLFL